MRAAASLFAAIVAGGRAAAQRVIRGYGANEDFANQALAAGGYPQQGYDAYPQQRSGGNYGGGFLEFMPGAAIVRPPDTTPRTRAARCATTIHPTAKRPTGLQARSKRPCNAACGPGSSR
jgi:hypothetical protein